MKLLLLLLPLAHAAFDGSSLDGSLSLSFSPAFAVRLFAKDQSTGFGSSRHGSSLPLYRIQDTDDLATVLQQVDRPVAAVLSTKRMSLAALDQLRSSGHLGGVLLLDEGPPTDLDEAATAYSVLGATAADSLLLDEDLEPFGTAYPWNPHGSGLALEAFDFPLVLLQQAEDRERVRDYAEENRREGIDAARLWTADFDFYMGPSTSNAAHCLEFEDAEGQAAPKCAPLGGQSPYGFFGPVDARPKVLAMASLDATALVHTQARGANAAACSILALLTAADLIAASDIPLDTLPQQIGLALFQGETYGRIGSRAFFADLHSDFSCAHEAPPDAGFPEAPGKCLDPVHVDGAFRNLSLPSIRTAIAVDQIGRTESQDGPFFLHTPDASFPLLEDLLALSGTSSLAELLPGVVNAGVLPPSPISSLVKEAQAQGVAAPQAVVLAGYNASYTDGAFGTQWDTRDRVDPVSVAKAATLLAQSLVLAAAEGSGGVFDNATRVAEAIGQANITEVEADLDCLLGNWRCARMEAVWDSGFADLARYLGVSFGHPEPDSPSFYTSILTATLFGQPVVQHRNGSSDVVYGAFPASEGAFDAETDFLYSYPGILEEWARVRLSAACSGYTTTRQLQQAPSNVTECITYKDCPFCPEQGDYWADGTALTNISMECLPSGRCACPVAFRHVALDPGLERQIVPSLFAVTESEGPVWTEPFWSADVSLEVRPMSSEAVHVVAICIGVAVLVLSFMAAIFVKQRLVKEKVV